MHTYTTTVYSIVKVYLSLSALLLSPSPADVMLVQPRVEFILSFIHHIAEDEDHSDGVVASATGLIG